MTNGLLDLPPVTRLLLISLPFTLALVTLLRTFCVALSGSVHSGCLLVYVTATLLALVIAINALIQVA